MRRFVRTEVYLDQEAVDSLSSTPGLSVLWGKWGEEIVIPDELLALKSGLIRPEPKAQLHDQVFKGAPQPRATDEVGLRIIDPATITTELPRVIISALQARPPRRSASEKQDENSSGAELVEFLLREPIVIEHSPPSWIKLKDLMDAVAKNPNGVGAVVGIWAAKDYPPLMLISVPLGIYLIGSAPGVTAAIQRGLIRVVDALSKKLLQKVKS